MSDTPAPSPSPSSSRGMPRRALDRSEQRVLEHERRLLLEVMKFGVPTFDLVLNLSIAYVDRARERQKRGTETEEDLKILKRLVR